MSRLDEPIPYYITDKGWEFAERNTFAGRYNGWTNYETWAVNVHLTNEPHIYERLMSIVQNPDTPGQQAEELKQWLHVGLGLMRDDVEVQHITGMYVDLLAAAFDLVDWKQIVQANSEGQV